MTAAYIERYDSREGTYPSLINNVDDGNTDLIYMVYGTEDDVEVINLVQSTAPAFYFNRRFINLHIAHQGGGVWQINCRYERRVSEDDDSFTFDTTGGTHKITQSVQTRDSYAATGDAPDFKGAIGVTEHAVDGVEIVIPSLKFTEKHTLPANLVDRDYVVALARLTGTTCSGSFRGFDVGEVLFTGASGSKEPQKDPEISFSFVASQNVDSLSIGDIAGITKRGHDYLWVRYGEHDDTAAKAIVRVPQSVYVEQVYNEADWSGLGIGA